MKTDTLKQFEGKEISVIVNGLTKPCGGILTALDDSFITIKPSSGKRNVIIIPTDKILSILHTDRGTDYGDER